VDPALLDVTATLGHGAVYRALRVALPIAAPGPGCCWRGCGPSGGRVDSDGVLHANGIRIELPPSAFHTPAWSGASRPTAVTWCVQPHDLRLTENSGTAAQVVDVVRLGRSSN
jgi:hypothetical protein